MFEEVDLDDGSVAWTAVHHPFTSPNAESLDTFDTDPGSAWPGPTTWSATATRSAGIHPYPLTRRAAARILGAGHR